MSSMGLWGYFLCQHWPGLRSHLGSGPSPGAGLGGIIIAAISEIQKTAVSGLSASSFTERRKTHSL